MFEQPLIAIVFLGRQLSCGLQRLQLSLVGAGFQPHEKVAFFHLVAGGEFDGRHFAAHLAGDVDAVDRFHGPHGIQ